MKEIRVNLTNEDYCALTQEAATIGISTKQLISDRVCGPNSNHFLLLVSRTISDELSKYRDDLNTIVRRAIVHNQILFEDDIIRIELSLKALENRVIEFMEEARKEAQHGNTSLQSNTHNSRKDITVHRE